MSSEPNIFLSDRYINSYCSSLTKRSFISGFDASIGINKLAFKYNKGSILCNTKKKSFLSYELAFSISKQNSLEIVKTSITFFENTGSFGSNCMFFFTKICFVDKKLLGVCFFYEKFERRKEENSLRLKKKGLDFLVKGE